MIEQKFLAIYFRMGMYNEDDDDVSPDLIGFDCPFDDSPVIYAENEAELERKVKEVCAGIYKPTEFESDWKGVDCRGVYPDVICYHRGNILADLYKKFHPDTDPDTDFYSFRRETLTDLWKREKWRLI